MSTLTMKHKIDLFNKLYKEISGHGINGDTELAHVNKYEAVVLKAMGGSGTVNVDTGLREYWGGDDPAPAPAPAASTTVTQVSDLPEYFKPYVEELFATSQDVYEKPYVPYGHQLVKGEDGSYTTEAIEDFDASRLAPMSKEQQAAFGGLRDMFTTLDEETGQRTWKDPTAEGFTEAERLATRGARGFDELGQVDPETGEVIKTAGEVFQETYMSPYKQAVTDIQTREAQKLQEQQRQKRQGAARMANALGQGRYGVEEALAGGIDAQLLDDIRKKGLQEAWTSGLDIFQKDRDAASSGARDRSRLTADKLSQGLKGLGALQTTGETQRALDQQKRDLSYEEFVRQQQFPKQNLQELSGILRGFQVQPTTYQTSQTYKPPMSLGQQLMAAGTLGAGISKGLGKSVLGTKQGGSVNAAGGGLLSVIPKRYAEGSTVSASRASAAMPNEGTDTMLIDLFPGHEVGTIREVFDRFSPTTQERLVEIYGNRKGQTAYEADQSDLAVKSVVRREMLERLDSGEDVNWWNQVKSYFSESPEEYKKLLERKDRTGAIQEKLWKGELPVEEMGIITDEAQRGDEIEMMGEEIVDTPTSSKDSSGWDIAKILKGYSEGFDAARGDLASYFSQIGKEDTAKALEIPGSELLKTTQADYYKGLALKAKAYEAIEKLKANRTLSQKAVETSLKAIKPRMDHLIKKMESFGLSDAEEIELQKLINKLIQIETGYGAFPASVGSNPIDRIRKQV